LTFAQIDGSYFGVYGTLSIPLDDFGDDDVFLQSNNRDESGFATFGFGAGVNFSLPIGIEYVQWSSDILFFAHLFSEDKAENDPVLQNASDISGGTYFFLPFLSGIRGYFPVNSDFGVFGFGQLGVSVIMQQTLDADGSVFGYPVSTETEFEPTPAFTWSLGSGVIINDQVSIGFRYLNMDDPAVDYTVSSGSSSNSGEREFDISMFQIFIGFNFGL